MGKTALFAFALLYGTSLSCRNELATAPSVNSRLVVFVEWQGQGVPGRQLEVVEAGLVKRTDANGTAVFRLRPGRYTLRAFVNRPGPSIPPDIEVTLRRLETKRVEVYDCVPCMSPASTNTE